MYYLYIILCADNTLYTGITNDLFNRMKVHEEGKGSKYVRSRLPIKIIHTEEFVDKSSACKREAEIKTWPRAKKIKLLKLDLEFEHEKPVKLVGK